MRQARHVGQHSDRRQRQPGRQSRAETQVEGSWSWQGRLTVLAGQAGVDGRWLWSCNLADTWRVCSWVPGRLLSMNAITAPLPHPSAPGGGDAPPHLLTGSSGSFLPPKAKPCWSFKGAVLTLLDMSLLTERRKGRADRICRGQALWSPSARVTSSLCTPSVGCEAEQTAPSASCSSCSLLHMGCSVLFTRGDLHLLTPSTCWPLFPHTRPGSILHQRLQHTSQNLP